MDGVEHGIDFPMIPSTSCLATIELSLQDESHSPIEAPTIATLSIFSLQSPTLQIEIVRSSREQAGTLPKKVETGHRDLASRRITGNGDLVRSRRIVAVQSDLGSARGRPESAGLETDRQRHRSPDPDGNRKSEDFGD